MALRGRGEVRGGRVGRPLCAESRRERAGAPKFNSFLINYHYNLFLIS
jgi:hypothetical protein